MNLFRTNFQSMVLVCFAMVLSFALGATPSQNQPSTTSVLSKSESQQIAYALGQDLAEGLMRRERSLRSIGIQLDAASMIKGFVETIEREASLKKKTAAGFSPDQLKTIVYDFERLIQKQEAMIARVEAERQQKMNNAFVKSYRQQADVEELANHILIKKLVRGQGEKPSIYDKVKIKLKVSLIDGTIIEDTGNSTIELRISQALAGWQKVITAMSTGDKWQAVIPPEMAWGSSRHGNIPANAVLICEFELVEIIR